MVYKLGDSSNLTDETPNTDEECFKNSMKMSIAELAKSMGVNVSNVGKICDIFFGRQMRDYEKCLECFKEYFSQFYLRRTGVNPT